VIARYDKPPGDKITIKIHHAKTQRRKGTKGQTDRQKDGKKEH
jgi:hypothetical protein